MMKKCALVVLTLSIFLTDCKKDTTNPNNNTSITTSPGTYLLFDEDPLFNSGQTSSPSLYTSLYYSKLDGSDLTRLTTPPSDYFDYRASFSLDGKHVVFIRGNTNGTDRGVYEININGDSLRNITKFPNIDYCALSPNSAQAAFAETITAVTNPQYQIWVNNVDGSVQRAITSYADIGNAVDIHWAKNGELYFDAGNGVGNFGIYSCNPDGSNVQKVISGVDILSVSNDAKYLLYYTSAGLYYSNIDGTNSKLIMSFANGNIGNPIGAAMTDDDKQVYFYYAGNATQSEGIYKINIDGTNLTKIMNGYFEVPSIF